MNRTSNLFLHVCVLSFTYHWDRPYSILLVLLLLSLFVGSQRRWNHSLVYGRMGRRPDCVLTRSLIDSNMICFPMQSHHFQCQGGGKEWEDIDCDVFDDPHPMTMALSVLVTIEMLNAMNRFDTSRNVRFIARLF